jgi:glycosyltransferase involved in cell wall biosynthesis
VIVAADWQPRRPLPNLTAGPVPHAEFLRLLADARACVVPLAASVRSAGQQTYLNAMALGKPCVVTEAPGVRDLVVDGVTGWIAPADPAGLRAVLDRVMAGGDDVEEAGRRARQEVLAHHTEFTYRRDLLRLAGLPVPRTQTRASGTTAQHPARAGASEGDA